MMVDEAVVFERCARRTFPELFNEGHKFGAALALTRWISIDTIVRDTFAEKVLALCRADLLPCGLVGRLCGTVF